MSAACYPTGGQRRASRQQSIPTGPPPQTAEGITRAGQDPRACARTALPLGVPLAPRTIAGPALARCAGLRRGPCLHSIARPLRHRAFANASLHSSPSRFGDRRRTAPRARLGAGLAPLPPMPPGECDRRTRRSTGTRTRGRRQTAAPSRSGYDARSCASGPARRDRRLPPQGA